MPRTRGAFGRGNLPAARAFLDSVYSSGGIRRGRGAKAPADLSDAQVIRYANSLQRQAAAGEPLDLRVARRGRELVRTGPAAGTYRPAVERREPRPLGQYLQELTFTSAAALTKYARTLGSGVPVQVTAYGRLGGVYNVPTYVSARLTQSKTGREWRTILTVPDANVPELANARALIGYSSGLGVTDVSTWGLRWQV